MKVSAAQLSARHVPSTTNPRTRGQEFNSLTSRIHKRRKRFINTTPDSVNTRDFHHASIGLTDSCYFGTWPIITDPGHLRSEAANSSIIDSATVASSRRQTKLQLKAVVGNPKNSAQDGPTVLRFGGGKEILYCKSITICPAKRSLVINNRSSHRWCFGQTILDPIKSPIYHKSSLHPLHG